MRALADHWVLMQLTLTQHDQSIGLLLESELAEVEARFAAELRSELRCVNDLVAHIEQFRGKMLRPTLVLVSGMACMETGQPAEAHRVLATVVEMVHMATLVHDDILDDAQVRRRASTINQLAGNEAAVMLGDYLISHAYHLCSSLGDAGVSRLIAETTNTVCEGELLQLANRNNWALDEQTYFDIIRRKTASLCGTCCRLSAVLAGADRSACDALYAYGECVGTAFQIADDLLDLMGTEDTVGKTLGRDLEKGKLTLPLIRYLATSDAPARDRLKEYLAACASPLTQAQVAQVRRWVVDTDAVSYSRRKALRLIEQAKAALELLPDSPARRLLAHMADKVLDRQS